MKTAEKKELNISCLTDPTYIATAFLNGFKWQDTKKPFSYTLIRWKAEFYPWVGGRYMKLLTDSIVQKVAGFLQQYATFVRDEGLELRITPHLINSVLANIAPMVHIKETQGLNTFLSGQPKGRFISLSNGILNFETHELLPHTPNFFNTSCLPYNYDPKANYLQWSDFLLDVMEGDTERVILLQQWSGYLLIPNLRRQKFLLISGPGANGKGVFFEILELLLGRENVSHVPFVKFGDKFALAPTLGKLANMSSESSSDITAHGENILKSYTAGDAMSFERKYLEPIEAVPTAKLMISTNELPRIEDKTQGVWRRMIFVPFEKSYPEDKQDKDLAEKLSENMSGIFNWALKGIDLLNEHNGFLDPVICREALAEYQLRMNPARVFLQELCEYDLFMADEIPCDELYREYEQWAEVNGFRPLNSSNFGREVFRTFPDVKKGKTTERSGKRKGTYIGLKKAQSVTAVTPNPIL